MTMPVESECLCTSDIRIFRMPRIYPIQGLDTFAVCWSHTVGAGCFKILIPALIMILAEKSPDLDVLCDNIKVQCSEPPQFSRRCLLSMKGSFWVYLA